MNNATPRLDIIIPVYNEGRNIGPTLRGAFGQHENPRPHPDLLRSRGYDTLPAIK